MTWMTCPSGLLIVSVTSLAACDPGSEPGDDADADAGVAAVTYYEDIKPLLDAKCTGCHLDGGIAPFSLETFAMAEAHGGEAKLNVEAGLMPPWPPNSDCNEYLGDRSLSETQKALFVQWVDEGMAMGDPAAEGAPIEVERQELTRVDLELEMPVTYTAVRDPDDYRCFVIPWPEETTRFVTGFRAVPGNPAVVHHVIAFLAGPSFAAEYDAMDAAEEGPGYTCFGGNGGSARGMIGAWAPGSLGQDNPAGTGIRVEPGSRIVLQLHYSTLNTGEPEPDLTKIQVKLDDAVEHEATVMPWANPSWLDSKDMEIPANEADVMHEFAFDATLAYGDDFRIYAAALHQHTLGTRSRVVIDRDDGGGEDCLLQIDDWNFHWQGSYGLREPIDFHRGDELRLECHWDNTAENQPDDADGEPRTPQDVYWGEGTTDEMCLSFLYVTAP
jgi:hypothetical protein